MLIKRRLPRLAGMGEISTADIQSYIAAVFQAELGRDVRQQGLDFYTQAVLEHGMTPEQLREDIIRNAAPEIAWRTAAATGAALPEANEYQASVWTAAATDNIPEPLANWGVVVPTTSTTTTRTVVDTRTASPTQIATAEANQILNRLQNQLQPTATTTTTATSSTTGDEQIDLPPVSKPVLIGGLLLLVLALRK